MSYGEAMGSCTLILLVLAVVSAVFTYIYLSVDGSFIEKIMTRSIEEMQKKDMPDEQLEKAEEMMRKMMKPHWMAMFGFLGYMFFGSLLGLIVSAFVKKDNPNPFSNTIDPSAN